MAVNRYQSGRVSAYDRRPAVRYIGYSGGTTRGLVKPGANSYNLSLLLGCHPMVRKDS